VYAFGIDSALNLLSEKCYLKIDIFNASKMQSGFSQVVCTCTHIYGQNKVDVILFSMLALDFVFSTSMGLYKYMFWLMPIKCPFVSKMHVCEIQFCNKSRWDMLGFDPLTFCSTVYRLADWASRRADTSAFWTGFSSQGLHPRQSLHYARLACIYCAYEWMIANPLHMANLGYHMHLVLYFGALIRCRFGGVCKHINK
jgi:hypothetical protein